MSTDDPVESGSFVVDVPPPRANGELVFDAPWQSRVFGLTAALAEGDVLTWPAFQEALIAEVALADVTGQDTGSPDGYWNCWLRAIGRLDIVPEQTWSDLVAEFSLREVGHDHRH